MAVVWLGLDTKSSPLGFLAPLDIAIHGNFLDLFYATCLVEQQAVKLFEYEYDAEVIYLDFDNPFDFQTLLKNITVETARWVGDRTIFYSQEKKKRDLANELSRQDVLSKKLANLSMLVKVRKDVIEGGVSSEEATKFLGQVLSDQQAYLEILPPPKVLPPPKRRRPRRPR